MRDTKYPDPHVTFNILGGKNNLKAEKKDHDEWDGDWGDWGGGW